jgi:hypothetical protein
MHGFHAFDDTEPAYMAGSVSLTTPPHGRLAARRATTHAHSLVPTDHAAHSGQRLRCTPARSALPSDYATPAANAASWTPTAPARRPYLTVSVPCMPAARCPGTEQ